MVKEYRLQARIPGLPSVCIGMGTVDVVTGTVRHHVSIKLGLSFQRVQQALNISEVERAIAQEGCSCCHDVEIYEIVR
jgi:hypothetical protein